MAKPSNAQYVKAARRIYHREGELEVDDRAKVSTGGDSGAYVQAWVWVCDADARKESPK